MLRGTLFRTFRDIATGFQKIEGLASRTAAASAEKTATLHTGLDIR
jgi:hypothetical protein